MKQLSANTIVQARPGSATADLGDSIAVLQQQYGAYFGMDGVAADIWQSLTQATTVGELRDRIVASYDVEPAQCEKDLLAFLGELAEQDLIDAREA